MKKIIALLLCLLMIVGMVACATTTDNNDVEIRFEIGIQSNLGHFFPFKG